MKEEVFNYQYRPGYGSGSMLIEFTGMFNVEALRETLFPILKGIESKPANIIETGEQRIIPFHGKYGKFDYSEDIWGFAFITAEDNQPVIERIECILSDNCRFNPTPADLTKHS
ncbi:hypothetical protein QEH52_18605 [Coraliomargarita sp. SDUM461003]|uniref:Uncharacterized protein n=1 Tax=Thalassobacterium maritimum TaxID=3041265 RepID=A0ABU1AZF5_9BACT|nr:hypothetical protein [Coraliomargarita sp. SDUM461003]MDQ8209543.1 hypothetical protein [Coraliomargarita sp. SDUM461003]